MHESDAGSVLVQCAECDALLTADQDHETTDQGVFCRTCFDGLTAQLHQAVEAQGQNINYPMALIGGLVGGALGILVWWGFTVVTEIAFGLVAVVIGITVGKGIVLLSGGKRSVNLQVMSTVISAVSFFYASYLVNRTFVLRAMAEDGQAITLPLFPDPKLAYDLIGLDFGIFDLVFLGIVIFQAWQIPAPVSLGD